MKPEHAEQIVEALDRFEGSLYEWQRMREQQRETEQRRFWASLSSS